MSAECLTPEESQQKIQQAAYQSITHLVASQDAGGSLRPLRLEAPISLAVDFLKSEMADGAALMPGSHRNGRRIEYTADDILTVFHAFCAILALAK
jgi:D-aminopeptidase